MVTRLYAPNHCSDKRYLNPFATNRYKLFRYCFKLKISVTMFYLLN